MRNILFMAVLAAGFAGCVGGIDSPENTPPPNDNGSNPGSNDPGSNPPGTGNAPPTGDPSSELGKKSKDLFDTNVYPAVVGACGGCHKQAAAVQNAPDFVATDKANGYLRVAGDPQLMGTLKPDGAKILTYGVNGAHKGIPYKADEPAKITEWLAAETAARAGGNKPDPNTPAAKRAAIENAFAKCMTLANFKTANMAIWAVVNSNDNNNNARCQSCHNDGQYNFIASGIPENGFALISTEAVVMRQYFTIDSADAPTKMIVNTTNLNAVATGADPHFGHRRFNLTNNTGAQAMTALNAFYTSTSAAVTAGNCAGTGLRGF